MNKQCLLPEDVRNVLFPKMHNGGYDMKSVDLFLDQVEDSLSAYITENKVLKSKMKILVDEIEKLRRQNKDPQSADDYTVIGS